MVYDLPVADVKTKPHQVTALHLVCALAFIGTGAIIYVYNYTISLWGLALLGAGFALLIVTVARNRWVTRQANVPVRIAELLIALAMAALSVVNQWKFPGVIFGILSAAIAFALYWEKAASQALYIQIDDTGIRLPAASRKRFLHWTEIEQVVFRYGILTVDCTNNTLYQWNIAGGAINDEILEAYCLAQVENNIKNRRKDDW